MVIEVCSRLKADPGHARFPLFSSLEKPSPRMRREDSNSARLTTSTSRSHLLVVQARVQTHLTLREAREQLAEEKRKVDRLLDNILPPAGRRGDQEDR